MSVLPFAFGGPPLRARLRAQPEDFFVDEDLGFSPDGVGEHVFVRVEKRGANTDWVARQIARFAGVAPDTVSYAGLKDRHAVTRQTFSVAVPIKRELAWDTLASDEFQVLDARRHGRKLKRGALKRNRFRIVLRDVDGDREAAQARLAAIAAHGVPNYFGEQRFGRDGDNVARAQAMFEDAAYSGTNAASFVRGALATLQRRARRARAARRLGSRRIRRCLDARRQPQHFRT